MKSCPIIGKAKNAMTSTRMLLIIVFLIAS